MDARAIIAGLRMGREPSQQELAWFANGLADQSVSDAQAGAFAMAVCLRGLSEEGRVALTLAMRGRGVDLGAGLAIVCHWCWPLRWRHAGRLCP